MLSKALHMELGGGVGSSAAPKASSLKHSWCSLPLLPLLPNAGHSPRSPVSPRTQARCPGWAQAASEGEWLRPGSVPLICPQGNILSNVAGNWAGRGGEGPEGVCTPGAGMRPLALCHPLGSGLAPSPSPRLSSHLSERRWLRSQLCARICAGFRG